ncbi:tRNA glutamyl-Q(34) synthetase GluQRS [Rothia sp. P7208]|uniref:tRNA glutamyl-Q(34) synthetase GluQRS n=1 Tax=Rothia sp. P7208 TaxID=3402660 RepID=UPI003AC8E3C0
MIDFGNFPSTDTTSTPPIRGRYAPSPSGDLHLGNLRTALLAWLMAHSQGGDMVMRVEDLDRVREGAAQRQLQDLTQLGITYTGEVLYQSTRQEAYLQAVEKLKEQHMVYECFCTRKEIQQATTAPHAAPGAYPGTCRSISDDERAARREVRTPALRLRSQCSQYTVHDFFYGEYTGVVDDFVLVRNDGTIAYNLAVVIDDDFQGVTQVVRGDDLLPSAPRQAYLAQLLGCSPVQYAHVPLALNSAGQRLAKRDGAVTIPELYRQGVSIDEIGRLIASSIPLPRLGPQNGGLLPKNASEMLTVFSPQLIRQQPWVVIDPFVKG